MEANINVIIIKKYVKFNLFLTEKEKKRKKTLMSHLILEQTIITYYLVENMLPNMTIYSTEGVIKQIDISVLINSTSQRHPLTLTTAEIYTLKKEKGENI